MRRVSIILFVATLLALHTEAQNVSNSEAFDVAQRFMAKKGITLVNDDNAATRGNAEPYSIFKGEDNKGFAIVVNNAVVGYSTDNTADVDNLPCQLKDMLNDYSKTITRSKTREYVDGVYHEDVFPSWFVPRDVTPIEPLIKTHWGQSSPYNDLLPMKTEICVTVTYAQLLHYFRVPKTYCDINYDDFYFPEIYLPMTEFDHDKMLNTYFYGEYTEDEAQEVSKFFLYIMYAFSGDYCVEIFNLERDQFEFWDIDSRYDWYDRTLEKGIPFWGSGNNHAYVIDGRDSIGLYHVNFGWGGSADGYYLFPDTQDQNEEIDGDYTRAGECFIHLVPKGWTSSINKINYNPFIDGSVYNLSGQCLGNNLDGLSKGIYIKNGKKQVVK